MVQTSFELSNVIGTVYSKGNVEFSADGEKVVSAVGRRVRIFDLVKNESRTLNYKHGSDICRIAMSRDGSKLISVDEGGRAVLVNVARGTTLHQIKFKKAVEDIKFSPDGRYILVTQGFHIQAWRTPSVIAREFAPFVLHRTYTGSHDDVTSIEWSGDGQCFLATSKDATARLYTLDPVEGFRPKTFSGHRDEVVAAYFSSDEKIIYTIARDGAVFSWNSKDDREEESSEDDEIDEDEDENENENRHTKEDKEKNRVAHTRWGIFAKHYCHSTSSIKVTCSIFHKPSSVLIVGFSDGTFGLWELPSFNHIHTLSISQDDITSVAVNKTGEWLAFGAAKMGQLLVWEWQSESYVLKQQGHQSAAMSCVQYSPDGQNLATGGEDGKMKLWNADTGFCFVTFGDHSAGVTAVEFGRQQGNTIFSASLDGTVRAYDLVRYRNFRTFTTPSPAQLRVLAVDPSGEVVCAAGAGTSDTFDIFLWSTQTGRLLDVYSGHTAPVSGLAFSMTGDQRLSSASWDRSVKIWTLYGKQTHETHQLSSEALCVAYRPDGKQIAVATLDGHVSLFDPDNGTQQGVIEAGGGMIRGMVYSADGTCILAHTETNVYIYSAAEGVILGTWTDIGRIQGVCFSPDGRSWVCASTVGVCVYTLDNKMFAPIELETDATPAAVEEALESGMHPRALILSLVLNDTQLVVRCLNIPPIASIPLAVRALPHRLLEPFLRILANQLASAPHLERYLCWAAEALRTHGRLLRSHSREYAPVMRVLVRSLHAVDSEVSRVCDENKYTLQYLVDHTNNKNTSTVVI